MRVVEVQIHNFRSVHDATILRGPLSLVAGAHTAGDSNVIGHAFRGASVPTSGTAITKILPPTSRFSAGGSHGEKKRRMLARFGEFFDLFFGLSAGSGD